MDDATRPFVFVIDDDEAIRASLKVALEAHCVGVEVFGSIEEFLLDYRPRDRSCLILDHHLPGATGLEFLQSEECRTLGLPVILMTGAGTKRIRNAAFEAGVMGYLEKPCKPQELLAMVYGASTR
jgi:two-component system, LuxR family, response regulator FixJ